MKAKLNDKQARFVTEYVKDCNATQAAIRAGYSKKTAGQQGEQLLKKPEIRKAVDLRLGKAAEASDLTVERVLRELSRMAFFDVRKLVNADGSPKQVQELDDDTAAAIGGLEVLEEFEGSGKDRKFIGYTKKYKIADKNSAIEKAMKHLKLLSDKVELTGKDGADLIPPTDPMEAVRRIAFALTQAAQGTS